LDTYFNYVQKVNASTTDSSYDILANCNSTFGAGMLDPTKFYVDHNDGTLVRSRFGPNILNFPWFNNKVDTNKTKLLVDAYSKTDLQYEGGGT